MIGSRNVRVWCVRIRSGNFLHAKFVIVMVEHLPVEHRRAQGRPPGIYKQTGNVEIPLTRRAGCGHAEQHLRKCRQIGKGILFLSPILQNAIWSIPNILVLAGPEVNLAF